uniref:biotin/lipoyl-containing protein n=1 Tax=Chromohalobacter sp. 11-W TaxID=2994061 RepID=UPI00246961B0
MSSEIIKVPDIGGSDGVEIIEVAVSEGDVIAAEDTMITLESDKASMDVPAPKGGKVVKVLVKEGDSVSEGDDILELEAEGGDDGQDDSDADASSQEDAKSQDDAKSQEKDEAEPEKTAPKKKSSGGGKRTVEVKVPDIGGSEGVEIIEVPVSEGDEVSAEDTLITLESDKASMDVPSPYSGKLVSLAVKEGDSVSEGDLIGSMEIVDEGDDADGETDEAPAEGDSGSAESDADTEEQDAEDETQEGGDEGGRKELRVPDIGGSENVPIIEIAIGEDDEISEEDTLVTLESDKASMDVPSPYKGKVVEVSVKEGDSVSEGDLIGYIEVAGSKKPAKKADAGKKSDAGKADQKADSGQQKASASKSTSSTKQPTGEPSPEARYKQGDDKTAGAHVHAGPAVRMLARELGVDLAQVTPTGPKNRVLKEDVQ